MTDFTNLVSSEEWRPLVEAVTRAQYSDGCKCYGLPDNWDRLAEKDRLELLHSTEVGLSAFLTAAVEKGVIKEVYFGMQPALVFAIIKTGDK